MTSQRVEAKGGALRLAAIGLALAAAGVAAYLAIVSLQMRGTPWGCGAGSGCASVLKSRWSNLAGIPVGFFALAAYASLVALEVRLRRESGTALRTALTIVATAVLSTATYFVFMQIAILRTICPWCMADHALGMASAVAALAVVRRNTPRQLAAGAGSTTSGDPLSEYDSAGQRVEPVRPQRRESAVKGVIGGVLLSLTFVLAQHFTGRAPDVARIDSVIQPADPGAGLKLKLKNGDVTLPATALPTLGSPAAPRQLILLFDYCCPHCREAHGVVRRLHAVADNQWQLIFVPVPLNSACNPAIEETEDRFRDACDLARISLAVWKLKPADWGAFDNWLFEPELPRSAKEARDHASALYGELEVAEQLIDQGLDEVIKADVSAYQATGARVLPVFLSPGAAGIAGRTETAEELQELLRREFGYPTSR